MRLSAPPPDEPRFRQPTRVSTRVSLEHAEHTPGLPITQHSRHCDADPGAPPVICMKDDIVAPAAAGHAAISVPPRLHPSSRFLRIDSDQATAGLHCGERKPAQRGNQTPRRRSGLAAARRAPHRRHSTREHSGVIRHAAITANTSRQRVPRGRERPHAKPRPGSGAPGEAGQTVRVRGVAHRYAPQTRSDRPPASSTLPARTTSRRIFVSLGSDDM